MSMPTQPADDVREALDADASVPMPNTQYRVWDRLIEFSRAYREQHGYPPNEAARTRFLFTAFDVRPRGMVTDVEVDAAAHAIAKDDPEFINGTYGIEDYRAMARAALEAAREVRL